MLTLWTLTQGSILYTDIWRVRDSIVTVDYRNDGLIPDKADDECFPETPQKKKKTAIMTVR